MWEERGKDKESEEGSNLLPGPRGRRRFSEVVFVWFSEEMKERPGMQNLRCRGAIVDFSLENGKFTSSTSCLYLWNNFTKRSYDI